MGFFKKKWESIIINLNLNVMYIKFPKNLEMNKLKIFRIRYDCAKIEMSLKDCLKIKLSRNFLFIEQLKLSLEEVQGIRN